MKSDEIIERTLDARQNRRIATDNRFLANSWHREDQAEALIRETTHDGRRIYYIMLKTGKTKEGYRAELIRYLLRNKYV